MRTLTFQGRVEFKSGWTPYYDVDQISAEKFRIDFGCDLGDGKNYETCHSLDVLYNIEQQCYVIREWFIVKLKADRSYLLTHDDINIFERPLEVSRCALVKSFEDAYERFSRYATAYEMTGISQILAAEIDDYSILDKFFGEVEILE